ncbi:hypothetical protein [Lacinutrix chionoecetis]
MLEIGNKTFTVDGVTVFPDHADEDQFWYLSGGQVKLARRANDNRAAFTLIKYGNVQGDTIQGKGFLMFEVNLKLDKSTERKIMSKISSLAKGTPKLAAVPFDEGTVECIALDLQGGGGTTAEVSAEGTFQAVENILGGTIPSLHGDNSAAFSLSLTKEGVTILEDVFKKKGAPVGAVYNLKYSALTPALDVEIKANLKRVYDHFSAGLEAQVYFVRAGIDAGFEKLVQDGVIEIKVINYSNQEDRATKEDWALNFFKEDLLNDWFKPTLTPGTLAGGTATASPLSAVQSLAQNMMRPAATAPPPVPTPASASTATPTPVTPPVARPDEASGATESEAVVTNPPVIAGDAANAANAATAMPPTTAPTTSAAAAGVRPDTAPSAANLSLDTALVSFKLKFIKQIEEKTLTFKFTRAEVVQRTYAPQGFFGLYAEDLKKEGHFFEIDGDSAFFREFKVTVETPFDRERIGLSSAHVKLNYGIEGDTDKKNKDFVIDKETSEKLEWLVKTIPGINKYSYSVQYHFDPDSNWRGDKMSYDFDDTLTEDRTLSLHPFDSLIFLNVVVSASKVNWSQVDSVEIELEYKSDTWSDKETLFFSESKAEDQHWKIRSSDVNNKGYTYTITYHMQDGTTRKLEPVSTEATRVVVNNPSKAINIEFIPLFEPDSVKTIFIDITYEDVENDYKVKERLKMTGETQDPILFDLFVIDDTKGTYSYQTTVVGKDNTLKRNDSIDTKETLIGIDIS